MKVTTKIYMSALLLLCFSMGWGRTGGGTSAHKAVAEAAFSFVETATISHQKDIPNASIQISTSGRPVFVAITAQTPSADPSFPAYSIRLSGEDAAHPAASFRITIVRDSTFAVGAFRGSELMPHNESGILEFPLSMNAIDSPQPGPHVYSVRVFGDMGKIEIKGARLVAYEM